MSDRNYWTTLRQRKISRRTMLGASAKAGVGVAGLALVGCGDDDDDDGGAGDAAAAEAAAAAGDSSAAAAAAERAAAAAEEAAAAAAAAGDATAAAVAEAAAAAATAAAAAAREAGAEQAQAAADAAAAAAAAAEDAAQAAREAADAATMADEEDAPAVAAAGEIDTEATLRIAVAGDQGGLDPQRAGSQTNYWNSYQIFDSGVRPHAETGSATGNLYTWEIPDAVTYVFTILPGISWHNGAPLLAEDIIFTHERVGSIAEYHTGGATSDHPAGWASAREPYGAQHWASYEVLDDQTFVTVTTAPDATHLGSAMRTPLVMSKSDTETRGDAAVDQSPMGTGNMRFVSHAEDTDFVFTRNEQYHREWSREPSPAAKTSYKDVSHLVRPEPLSRIAGIEAGELDVAYSMAADIARPLEDDPSFQVIWGYAGQGNMHLIPNLHITETDGAPNPFLDIRVRQAANHAVNKDAIIQTLLVGTEGYSYGHWAGSSHFPKAALDAIGPYAYDPDLAKALLAEAGYPDGFSYTLHLPTDYAPQYPTIALVLQQDFAAVGIDVELREYPSGEFFAMTRTKEVPGLYFFQANLNTEPESVLGSTTRPDGNGTYALAPFPEMQPLYEAQKTATDPADRDVAMEELLVTHYLNASYVYLTELFGAAVMGPNIEWNVGAAQARNHHSLYQINVFRT